MKSESKFDRMSRPCAGFTRSAGLALGAAALLAWSVGPDFTGYGGAAWAETHEEGGHESGGGSGGRGKGGGGSHGEGEADSGEEDHGGGHGGSGGGGHEDGGSGGGHDKGGGAAAGGRGPQSDSDSDESPRGRRGGAAGSGGKPVWAQEGIPEVELGRLNVARSPDHVLDRAYAEALSSFGPEVAAFYSLDLATMERELSTNWDNVQFIDSPLQNLALMRDALDGESVLRDVGIATDNGTLLAVFLGTASDKAVPVTTETALAVSAILDQPLSAAAAAALAEDAERIRQAILAGHG
jgi:hypothetical protein